MTTTDDWEKVSEAETVYREWFDRLDHEALYAEVGDHLFSSHHPDVGAGSVGVPGPMWAGLSETGGS